MYRVNDIRFRCYLSGVAVGYSTYFLIGEPTNTRVFFRPLCRLYFWRGRARELSVGIRES